jgi:bacteriocin-like protein
MTDDFIILSDAELDQVSGGGYPYVPQPPHHTGHDTLGWHQRGPSVSAITPFRDLDFYIGS